jgi:drug/metabolite transporter (DMT)-like permease
MSGAAVGLVLAGSLAHAAWNVLVKRAPSGGPVFVWVYSVISVVLLAPVALLAARGEGLAPTVLAASAVSAVLHMAYALTLQWAYSRSDMNVTYPVARGTGPLLVVLFAVVALHQRLTWVAAAGIAAVLVGVGLASVGGPSRPGERGAGSGALHGVLVGATIAGYTLWDDHAINVLHADAVTYYVGTAVLQSLMLTVVCWRRRRDAVAVARAGWRTAVAVAVLVPTSYLLVLLAMHDSPIALVAVLRCTSIVFGSLAAWLVLGERSGARRLSAAVVVLVGVGALVAPNVG